MEFILIMNLLPKKALNGTNKTGGRPIKELTKIDATQFEALAAVFTKSQMAAFQHD